MRAVIQRVSAAAVTVAGVEVGAVRPVFISDAGHRSTDSSPAEGPTYPQALCVLLGVTHADGPAEVAVIARKIAQLRILRGEVSAVDVQAPVLLVSQFTLYADARKGRRPSWSAAAPSAVAEPLVDAVATALRDEYGLIVATGQFGADMQVSLTNDGPVTIVIEAEPAAAPAPAPVKQ